MPACTSRKKTRLLKSRKCLVYVLTVKQNETCSRPNELLTALARTWPHENITTELYRLLELWSIAKNNMWTRTTLFQSTHLFFNHDRYVLQIHAVKQNIN